MSKRADNAALRGVHHVSTEPKAGGEYRKGEARAVLGKLPGLWRPTNLDLAKRMPELYPKSEYMRQMAHET